jgi:hypothetical protein
MALITEYVYINRNNGIDLLLNADGAPQDLAVLTRAQIKDRSGNVIADSSTTPAAFDWNTAGNDGILKLYLGSILTTANRYSSAELIVYDSVNTSGVCWGKFNLVVQAC